jgi:hypothetical protein
MVSLTDITLMDVEYICLHMRERDKQEIFGLRPHNSEIRLAWEAYHHILNCGRGRIAWHKGKPAALAAFTESWPGVWDVWMAGTEDFEAAAIPLLRWFRKEANEILSVCNGHRLQCDSRADYESAHKMIEAFGGQREAVLRKLGKDGSDYIRFVWFNGENDAVLKPHFGRKQLETQEG